MATSTLREPTAHPPVDGIDAGVIQDARRRQRNRRRTIVSVSLIILGASIAAYMLLGGEPAGQQPIPDSATALTPSVVLAATPHMGVACASPNTIGCDRLGLSLILRRPALAVQATIAGGVFDLDPDFPHYVHRLDTPNPDAHAPAIAFAGYLRPAGLRERLGVAPDVDATHWIGRHAPTPLVQLRVSQADGSTVTTQLRVRLSAGWN